MLCFRYKSLLIGYAECELDERTTARVEAHIAKCPSCASELDMIRSVSGAIKAAENPAMEPTPDLWAKVSARIEREAPRPTTGIWLRVTQATSACAAAALVAVVGIGLLRPSPPAVGPITSDVKVLAKAPMKDSTPRTEKIMQRVTKKPVHTSRISRPSKGPASQPMTTPKRRYFASTSELQPAPTVSEPVASPSLLEDDGYSAGGIDKGRVARLGVGADNEGIAGRPASAGKPAPPALAETLSAAGRGTVLSSVDRLESLGESVELKCATTAPAERATSETIAPKHFRYDNDNGNDLKFKTDASTLAKGLASEPGGVACAGVSLRASGYGSVRNSVLPPSGGSVVDELNKTEGVRVVALFSYP